VDEAAIRAIMTEPSVERLRSMDFVQLRNVLPRNLDGDAAFARVLFAHSHNRLPGDPALFHDMLYGMKVDGSLYDPVRQFITDKEYVKDFVAARVGSEYVVPTLAVLRSPTEAMNFRFSEPSAVKPTHMSGVVGFVDTNGYFDWPSVQAWWGTNFYLVGREANYAYLRPKAIVEPVLFGDQNVTDYKFFCWKGVPRVVQVDIDRRVGHKRAMYDSSWNQLPTCLGFPVVDLDVPRPPLLSAALEISRELSKTMDFLRVDVYMDAERVLVGELTNCPGNATEPFSPGNGERVFSELLFST
jgi:hypothetical protein